MRGIEPRREFRNERRNYDGEESEIRLDVDLLKLTRIVCPAQFPHPALHYHRDQLRRRGAVENVEVERPAGVASDKILNRQQDTRARISIRGKFQLRALQIHRPILDLPANTEAGFGVEAPGDDQRTRGVLEV